SLPDVFIETHVPNRKTFERVCEAFTYMLRVYFSLEGSTTNLLGDVKNVGDQTDRCNTLHNQLQRTPPLPALLRDVLSAGRNDGGFRQRMTVVYAATCSLPVGLRNVILRSGEAIRGKLDVAKWGLGPNPGDGAIGKHYRANVQKSAPDEILGE